MVVTGGGATCRQGSSLCCREANQQAELRSVPTPLQLCLPHTKFRSVGAYYLIHSMLLPLSSCATWQHRNWQASLCLEH
jgi:hypothetical protein